MRLWCFGIFKILEGLLYVEIFIENVFGGSIWLRWKINLGDVVRGEEVSVSKYYGKVCFYFLKKSG